MPTPRPRAACSACSKRTAACHQSSTIRGQPGIAVAQHGRWRAALHPGRSKRLPERLGCGRLAVTGEGEAVLGTPGVDHLARDHLEVWRLRPVPAAHVAAIKSNHDGAGHLRRGELRILGRWRSGTTSWPTRNVLFRTVPAFCAPLIGNSSDRRVETLPKGTSAAIGPSRRPAQVRQPPAGRRSRAAKLFGSPGP